MNRRMYFLSCALIGLAFQASAATLSHANAKKLWEQSKERTGYSKYSDQFAKFNEHFRLDEKDGCYRLNPGPVTLYLVITHSAGERLAAVEQVVSDVDNAKARCFRKTYTGLPTKIPPFLPLVLQMKMGK